jgi:hypothetical protein
VVESMAGRSEAVESTGSWGPTMHHGLLIGGRALLGGICLLSFAAGWHQPANAQEGDPGKQVATASAPGAKPSAQKGMYYVDFRARTAASYGHAFTWYGRTDQKKVEVAGLHPATDSVLPYILGHVLPVPSETGASYGDLDPEYLTASYRVLMSEEQGKRVVAYIKHLQATSPVWNAATYNCVAFIQDIARYMGLRVPGNHLLYPEDWVNQLRSLNGGGKVGRMPGSEQAERPAVQPTRAAQALAARAPAAQRSATAASAQTAHLSANEPFRLMD